MTAVTNSPVLLDRLRTITDAVSHHGRVALLFSGGIESCLLLNVLRSFPNTDGGRCKPCEPLVNTGALRVPRVSNTEIDLHRHISTNLRRP